MTRETPKTAGGVSLFASYVDGSQLIVWGFDEPTGYAMVSPDYPQGAPFPTGGDFCDPRLNAVRAEEVAGFLGIVTEPAGGRYDH